MQGCILALYSFRSDVSPQMKLYWTFESEIFFHIGLFQAETSWVQICLSNLLSMNLPLMSLSQSFALYFIAHLYLGRYFHLLFWLDLERLVYQMSLPESHS